MGKTDRIGEKSITKEGYEVIIVEYNNNKDIIIEFQDEYKSRKKCAYTEFKIGSVRNPYHRSVYDVGYLGVGKYSHKTHKLIYDEWNHMLGRCYNPYALNKCLTYIDCYVYDEWHNFQNFAKWYEENYYECNEEKMCLDKDILYKGNKIYSPKTCIFTPEKINVLFVRQQRQRGNFPIGVSHHKSYDKLEVYCRVNKKKVRLGFFELNQIEDAFNCYKQFKENHIKQVADEYKDLIPQRLYDAMYNYEVEIND